MEGHSGPESNSLGCLMKSIVGSLPVEDPHPNQRQEGRIVDLGPIHLMKPLCPSDHVGPKPIVKEKIWVCITPPLVVCGSHILSSVQDSMEGILGNLETPLSVSFKQE